MDAASWFRFLLAVLAAWRVTHLLACEDGPADLLARLRARLGKSAVGQLMDCFQCLSFWVAAPLAFFVGSRPLEILVAWLALAGAACLLERLGQEPLMMRRTGDNEHGMLWAEEGRDASRAATAAGEADRRAGYL